VIYVYYAAIKILRNQKARCSSFAYSQERL